MQKNDTKIREQVDKLGRPDIEMLDREIARHNRKTLYKKLAKACVAGLLVVAAIIILLTNLWIAILRIGTSSMAPSLQIEDVVIAVKTDNPVKNDIIAFYYNNTLSVKRVIATSGDRVEIDSEGTVFVNDTKLDEPYVTEKSLGVCDIEFPFIVPAGTVFVLGDNRRTTSFDSRDSKFGTVTREQIIGKVVFNIWPFAKFGNIA